MEKRKSVIEFSLDCEKVWGLKKGVPDRYIQNYVGQSDYSLRRVISEWGLGTTLYLAFVMKSLPTCPVDDDDLALLAENGYANYTSNNFTKFNTFNYHDLSENIRLGLHSTRHRFYTELEEAALNREVVEVGEFVADHPMYGGLFVYPKNLVDGKSVEQYSRIFHKIRVNSVSWLYRTSPKGVGRVRRLLRYLDSFLPIYELFCDKRPEHALCNAVAGTHFFRANLPVYLLIPHYLRLRFGIALMSVLGKDVHVWSHPHNFGGNDLAIRLFVALAR